MIDSQDLTRIIDEMLWAMSMNGKIRGFTQCKIATRLAVERGGNMANVMKDTAAEYGTKIGSIRRNIQYFSQKVWDDNSRQLQVYAGKRKLFDRPSSGELVAILSTYILKKEHEKALGKNDGRQDFIFFG